MILALAGIEQGMRVLDIGTGWGVYAIAAAKLGAQVWAIDANPAGLGFLSDRCRQEGLSQVKIAQGTALKLPFPKDSFDLVMMNGVFELLPEYINEGSPEEVQCRALKEAGRVLNPQGHLVIAIENRYGLPYLTGSPDEHTGLRFITVMPRAIASLYSYLKLGKPFRIYTHSVRGLQKIIKKNGFCLTQCYGAYPNYRFPDYLYCLNTPSAVSALSAALRSRRGSSVFSRLQSRIFRFFSEISRLPEILLRKYPFSLVVLATKNTAPRAGIPSITDVLKTRRSWLVRRTNGKGAYITKYAIRDDSFQTFDREGQALSCFAKSENNHLVPKVVEEEMRPGSRTRVFQDLGTANVLARLQKLHWAPELQIKVFAAFLSWLDSARKVPANGFSHKYEVMPRVSEAIRQNPRIADLAIDFRKSCSSTVLSNADFNPTNLILSGEALVVLDWECPCRENPVMVLGHFFLHLTLFADRFAPVFKARRKRPERWIGEQFRRAIAQYSSFDKELPASLQDIILWIATDFSAQFNTAQPPVPPLKEILQRLSGVES